MFWKIFLTYSTRSDIILIESEGNNMEKLRGFIMSCLHGCTNSTYNRESWMHQAFGAVQFYVFEHPEEYEEVAGMWSELKPHFERKIWGVSFEL